MANEEKNGVQYTENEELSSVEAEDTEAAQIEPENNNETDNEAEKAEDVETDGDSADKGDEDIDFDIDDGDGIDDDEDAADDSTEKPRKKKHGLLIAGIAALLIAGAGAGYYYWYLPMMAGAAAETEPAKTLVMPDLLYESQEVAEGIAGGMGLPVDIYYVSSESVPSGLVTLQSTSAGAEVPEGEAIAIYVSLGAEPTPAVLEPLPTPTPKATPKPTRRPKPIEEIVAVAPTVTPCG